MLNNTFSISVVLPTYNRLNRIKKTLVSFLATKVSGVQFIIVDNHSDDGTWEYLQEVAISDQRVELYRNPQNVGGVKTIFRGYCEVKSPYVIFLADDDVMVGDYIERCLEIFEKHDDVALIHHLFDGWQVLPDRYKDSYTIYPAGNIAIEKIFMYAGSYPGLAFRMSDYSLGDFSMGPGVIYPQVKIAIEMAGKKPLAIINDCGLISTEFGDTIATYKKMQSRPDDMGISERLSYALLLKDSFLIQPLALQLSGWAKGLLANFEKEDQRLAEDFVKSLSLSLNIVTPDFICYLLKSRRYRYALTSILRLILTPSFFRNYGWFLLFAFKKFVLKGFVKRKILR